MKKILLCGLAALAPALPFPAWASCGAAFCSINTSWDAQGAWLEPGARLDLRYEYIRQDQPMSGRNKVSVGQIPRHHDEVVTRNENWLPGIDFTLDQDWGLNASLPVVKREHEHIHNHGGGRIFDAWNFSGAGDARIVARRRLASWEDNTPSTATLGANFGLKLPTGRTDVRNSGGELAERSLQPGTGTTDLLAGLYYSRFTPVQNVSWFIQGMAQVPLRQHADYRPGNRYTLDTGLRYLATDQLSLLLQANALVRKRDGGAQGEPDDTGGTALFLSPGVSYALTREVQMYGFLQLPVYQYVNGVQLTARHALAIGVSTRF